MTGLLDFDDTAQSEAPDALTGRRASARNWLAVPANRALILLVAAGLILRSLMSIAIWPTFFDTGDVWQHVVAADGDLFGNPLGPAGYAIFLRLLRPFSSSVVFPVLVQHAFGLVAMVLAYDAMVRLGVSRWAALFPPFVIGLCVDQVVVEHFVMTDALFGFLLLLGFWLLVRSQQVESRSWWLAACGLAFGAAMAVRFAGLPILVASMATAVLVTRGSLVRRLLPALLVLAGALGALVPYHAALFVSKDRLSPTAASGWSLYVRVAPFADCSKFEPPSGTAHLCETSNPNDRPGADYYAWDGGPARATYGDFMIGNEELRSFASAAIAAQPFDYAKSIVRDFVRYYTPIGPARPHRDGLGRSQISGGPPDVAYEKSIEETYERYYDDTAPSRRPGLLDALGSIQPVLRFGTPLMLASVIAALVGLIWLRGQTRVWAVFPAAAVMGLIGMCAMSVGYVWRYAVPMLPFAAMSVVLVISGIIRQRNRDGAAQL